MGLLIAGPWICAFGQTVESQPEVRAAQERAFRHRASVTTARRIAELLADPAAANSGDALRVAQRLLDTPFDSFLDDLRSTYQLIEDRLRAATADQRRTYLLLVSADAEAALKQARQDLSREGLQQVYRRYFLTPAGFAAAEQLIALWVDAGEFELAARLLDLVLADPAHTARITPQLRTLRESLNGLWQGESPRAAAPDTSSFATQLEKHRATLIPWEAGWMLPGGDPARNRRATGTPPVLTAEWTAEFFSDQASRARQDQLRDWEGGRRELEQPCCPAAHPILVHNTLISRSPTGLRALDARSGRTAWTFPCEYRPELLAGSRQDRITWRLMSAGLEIPTSVHAFAENTTMGTLVSDGRHVYFLDSLAETDSGIPRPFPNRLVALHVSGPRAGKLAWSSAGQGPSLTHRVPSAGPGPAGDRPEAPSARTFLGPPLPGATELLCLTEFNMEVQLTALDPTSGNELWNQPLCSLDRAEQFDLERHELACIPVRSAGIVVCPTNTGLLVAVDQVRRTLLWAAYVDDVPDAQRRARPFARAASVGAPGLAAPVILSGDSVVVLSSHSSRLQCLDLKSGQRRWSIPRPGDADGLALVRDGRILISGRRSCRAVSLADGRELWFRRTGPVAGRGIPIQDHFAVPLESGHVARFDLTTGQDAGAQALASPVALGHLVADQERVYSMSHRGLAAFPQVNRAVRTLQPMLEDNAQMLLQVEVSLVRGQTEPALALLRELRQRELSSELEARVATALRHLLFARLESAAPLNPDEQGLLEELLVRPEDQLRFVMLSAARPETGMNRDELFLRAYRLSEATGALQSAPDDWGWNVSPAAWCRLHVTRDRALEAQQRLSQHPEESAQFARVFDAEPVSGAVRAQLARTADSERRPHAAEVLWLRNTRHPDASIAAEATRQLMELWSNSGFTVDAARQLDLLATRYAKVVLADGRTGAAWVRALESSHPVKEAWIRSRAPEWPVDHVEIRQFAATPGFAEQPGAGGTPGFQADRLEVSQLGRYLRAVSPSVDLVMSSTNADERLTLTVFDQRSRHRLGAMPIPLLNQLAPPSKQSGGGHSLVLGVPSGVMGISTLQLGDSQPVWSQFPEDLAGRRSAAIPGPSAPEFASFSWRNRLYVMDPLDGTLLWERHLPIPAEENAQSVVLDVIGDREVLAIRGSDRTMFDVFDTATGQGRGTVRTGFLPGQWQGAWGRFVAGFVESDGLRRLEIRDLKSDAVTVSELVGEVARQPLILPTGELMMLGGGGEVKMYDLSQGKLRFVSQLEREDLLPISFIRVVADKSRYYVNLQRIAQTVTTAHFNQPLNFALPGMNARDDVYAFDRETGELQWKRAVPSRTILQFPDADSPVLVTMSLVKHQVSNDQSLTVEVLDARTGITIGYRENLKVDQFLTADYDGREGRITLQGISTTIELGFGPIEGQTVSGHRNQRRQTWP